MSFYGSSFVFDGIPGEQYGLMIAGLGGTNQSAANFGGDAAVLEDRINGRSTALHYGTVTNKALSFPISFTVVKDQHYLDRYDAAAVAGWLTGHQTYKVLSIQQDDMQAISYRCLITKLVAQEVGGNIVGFTATVNCDGPFAYRRLGDTVLTCSGEADARYRNLSNVNDYYRPVISIVSSNSEIIIENVTDGSTFSLKGMPGVKRSIHIDCLNQVMTSDSDDNLYLYFSGKFPRFVRGDNELKLTGDFTMVVENMMPWNIGH